MCMLLIFINLQILLPNDFPSLWILHFPPPFNHFSLKLQRVELSLGPYACKCGAEAAPALCVLGPHSKGSPLVPEIKGRAAKVMVVRTGMLRLKRAERKWAMFQWTDAELMRRFNLRSPGLHPVLCGIVKSPVRPCLLFKRTGVA